MSAKRSAPGTGILRDAAEACGLGAYLAVKLGRWRTKTACLTTEDVNRLATVRCTDAEIPYAAVVAHNILFSKQPVHTPLPVEWVQEAVTQVHQHLARLGGTSWAPFWATTSQWAAAGGRAWRPRGSSCKRLLAALTEYRSEVLRPFSHSSTRRGRPLIPPVSESDFWGPQVGGAPLASEAATTGRISRSRRDRACGRLFSDAVTRVYARVQSAFEQLYGKTRSYSSAEICKAIEDAAVGCLCGAIVEGNACEGKRSQRLVTLAPSRSAVLPGVQTGQVRGPRGQAGLYARMVSQKALADAVNRVTVSDVMRSLRSKDSAIRLRSMLLQAFPRKPHPEAGTKCNVYLDCVLVDLLTYRPELLPAICAVLDSLPSGVLYEDQVAGCLVFMGAYKGTLTPCDILRLVLPGIVQLGVLKGLTDLLKATGSNTVFTWAMLCELQCLLGRGAADYDLRGDAETRVSVDGGSAVVCDERALAEAIDHVLLDELGSDALHCDTLERHWDRRFEWCVAGAHSAATNQNYGFSQVPKTGPGGLKMTRRMAMEHVDDCPLDSWDGTTAVSVVPKLEHGKTRAIYSCNTMSYAQFSRVLRPAERKWAGRRVIVDPGAGGSYGMFRRIRGAWPATLPVALMIDYADFNSQHTLQAQQLVISALLSRYPGMDDHERQALVSSFDKMDLFFKGEHIGRVKRSLMSGHRGTSFINSVLNAAYIRMVVGEEVYNGLQSFHVGDDVLMFCRDAAQAYSIIDAMRAAGFILQKSKQSVGSAGFEFLRMSGTRDSAHGYLARAVASCVSGNWTTEWKEAPVAALHTAVQTARSIINRSQNIYAWQLLVSSARAHTNLPAEVLEEVLSGRVALGNGPCYRDDGRYESREILEVCSDCESVVRSIPYGSLPRAATRDYLFRGRCDLEAKAMQLAGFKPWGAALRSTYGDLAVMSAGVSGYASEPRVPTRNISLGGRTLFTKSGETVLDNELDRERRRGVLVQYPLISLLQHALTDPQLGELLRASGHAFEPGSERVAAFGGVREGATVRGWLPYADAAALGANIMPYAIRVLRPLYL